MRQSSRSPEEENLIYDLTNGEGSSLEEQVRVNSRGLAKLLQHSLLLRHRLDWHEKLLYTLLAAGTGIIGIVVATS